MADPSAPPFGNPDVITASYDVIISRCGRHRKHLLKYYQSSKPHCHGSYSYEVMEGEGRNMPAPHPLFPASKRAKIKPCLNRVKSYLSATGFPLKYLKHLFKGHYGPGNVSAVFKQNNNSTDMLKLLFLDSSAHFNLQKFQIDQTGKNVSW